MASLFASATLTLKTNQDFASTVENSIADFIGVIVADGIGSHFKAEIASKFCVQKLKEKLEKVETVNQINFEVFFLEVKEELVEYAKQSSEFDFEKINVEQSLGTTLICVIETAENFVVAYSGNGSVWHVKGDFNEFGPTRYLPWNSTNLLTPHCVEQEGKAALNRYISISKAECRPTVLQLSKDLILSGDIFVITTDGIYSTDQAQVGKDDNGMIWIRGEESMPVLYKHLSLFLKKNPAEFKSQDLESHLNHYLETLKEMKYIHDDTTIGVIITQTALNYHKKTFEKQSTTVDEENSSK
jgi:PPM family protein phosphatase